VLIEGALAPHDANGENAILLFFDKILYLRLTCQELQFRSQKDALSLHNAPDRNPTMYSSSCLDPWKS